MSSLPFLWHEDVHKRFREDLLYLQLTFLPVYKRQAIFARLRSFFEEKQIYSYCIYELYGYYDVLIRLWVPPDQQPSTSFRKEIQAALEDLGCIRAMPFYVGCNPCHWMWLDAQAPRAYRPSREDVQALPVDVIRSVNEGTRDEGLFQRLEANYLIRKHTPRPGIKFFLVIPPPALAQAPTIQLTENLVRRLQTLLRDSPRIVELSIYTGEGFAWILLKGKVLLEGYADLDAFVQAVNEAGAADYQIRTYTYLATGSPGPFTVEMEGISLPATSPPAEITDANYYLCKEEDERFEVKASLSLDVNRLLRDKSKPSLSKDPKIALDGVLRAIVAFLNSDGGTVLLGILERSRYIDILQDPNGPLGELPAVEGRVVFGIEREYGPRGWDEYSQRLAELIEHHIDKAIASAIHVHRVDFRGHDLCVIDVPSMSTGWYYLDKKQFWVKRSNTTQLLEGVDLDAYKQLRPRNQVR